MLAQLVAKHHYKRIVIAGPAKSRAQLLSCMTNDVKRRVVGGERVDALSPTGAAPASRHARVAAEASGIPGGEVLGGHLVEELLELLDHVL